MENNSSQTKEPPRWISEPMVSCSHSELCVVGEGSGRLAAEANARAGVSKFFETHVKVHNTTTLSAESSIRDEVVSGGQDTVVQGHVDELSVGLIEGVLIREVFEKADGFYALAVLNKNEANRYYGQKIRDLDELNTTLFENFKRSSYFELRNNLMIRANLAARARWLGGNVPDSPMSPRDMEQKKQLLLKKPVVVLLEVDESEFSKKIKNLISTQLVDSLYRVVSGRQNGFDYMLKVSFIPRKEFLKVDGFEKYSFMLHLEAFNRNQERIGGLHKEETVLARTIDAAFLEVLPKINKYLNDNFGSLSIE